MENTKEITLGDLSLHVSQIDKLVKKIEELRDKEIPNGKDCITKQLRMWVGDFGTDHAEELIGIHNGNFDDFSSVEEFIQHNHEYLNYLKHIKLYNNGVVELNYNLSSEVYLEGDSPKNCGVYYDSLDKLLSEINKQIS